MEEILGNVSRSEQIKQDFDLAIPNPNLPYCQFINRNYPVLLLSRGGYALHSSVGVPVVRLIGLGLQLSWEMKG